MQDQANQGTMDPKQGLGPQGCEQTGLRGQNCDRLDIPEPKLPRELKEILERETLDPKATKAAESLGRLRPEPHGKDPVRTDFEREIGGLFSPGNFAFCVIKPKSFLMPGMTIFAPGLSTLCMSTISAKPLLGP